MPLSKAKDRERKKKKAEDRLESNPGFKIGKKVLEPAYEDYYRVKAKAAGYGELEDYLIDILHKRADINS